MIKALFSLSFILFTSFTVLSQATELPVANFALDETSGCAPLQVQFFDFSEHTASWHWTFPGGQPSSSTEAEPQITFNEAGTFQATLVVTNDLGSDTASFNLVVKYPPPVADFSFQLSGMEAQFSNHSTGAEQYVWEFGDGTSSTATHPIHTYQEEGVYLVKLVAANDCTTKAHTDVVVLSSGHEIPSYTANDFIPNYEGSFLPGVNLGYFPPWKDDQLADIAAGNPEKGVEGVGVKTIRPALFDHFLETWGYDIRIDEFQHYIDLKLKDNTVIVGFPSDAHRDTTFYCPEHQSELFANLYTDIWDNGENGTPINDENYFALYLYRMVHLYGDNIKFWEIWNEPGFDFTFLTGFLPPGEENSWWDNNPDPCDYKLRAPIFHYIRTLRIAYEVIKYIHPDDYVTLASVGYPSFMDAILRNTDNPEDGSVSSEYPLGGGAYFDVVTIHSYPHFDGTLRYWDEDLGGFVHNRHSDAAAGGIERTKTLYQAVLADYGYDDVTYPAKEWIITEINVPRKPFGDFIGGEEVQINYIIKAYIEAVRNEILNMHIYDMSESHGLDDAVNEFQLMGLYQRLFGIFPYNQVVNSEGIAYKTTSDLLFGSSYDVQQTQAMQLPEGVVGHAFLDPNGHYTYALWAATNMDNSEEANALYTFPTALNIDQLERRNWNFAQTNLVEMIDGQSTIVLDARPIFLTDLNNSVSIAPTADFAVNQEEGCIPLAITFEDQSTTNVEQWQWSFIGGSPATSSEQNPSVVYENPGVYPVSLTVSNAAGTDILVKEDYIIVSEALPAANFEVNILGQVATFVNLSENATSYFWDLADGNMSTLANPSNDYSTNSYYDIVLIASNGCGSDTSIQDIIIGPNELVPHTDFSATQTMGCAPLTVQFYDTSTENVNNWWWEFQGGSPSSSSEQNPVITYESPGSFFVKLIAGNDAGSDSKFKANFIEITGAPPVADFTFGTSGLNAFLFNSSDDAQSYFWDFGDGNSSTETDPIHVYATDGSYTLQLIAFNECGSDTINEVISLSSLPTAGFSATTQNECTPATIQFVNQSASTTTAWNWSFPGGNPANSSDPDPIVVYEQAGFYDVELVVSNELGQDTLVQDQFIHIQNPPEADFTIQFDGLNAQLSNQSMYAEHYSWNFGDGNSSTEIAPAHSYAMGGTYLLQLIAFNTCGSDTISETIVLNSLPTAGFMATLQSECAPSTVQFINQSSANTTDWSWSFPGGNPASSSDSSPIVVYEQAGIYDVDLIVGNELGQDTLSQENFLQIQQFPEANFMTTVDGLDVYCSNLSIYGNTFHWDFGDGNSSTAIAPQHTYATAGEYTIELMVENDCGIDSLQQTIGITTTRTEWPESIEEFTLFPNPNGGQFHLKLSGPATAQLNVGMINILGQVHFERQYPFQTGYLQEFFHFQELSPGIYLLFIEIEEFTLYQKVIIE
ncbi:MAG: PKD domain-containing protein [Bacteroidota bacterium]